MTQTKQVETGLGNTILTPAIAKNNRKYCFTLNNYTEDNYETIISYLKRESKEYIVGKEVGLSGTPHLQGFILFKCARSFKSVQKNLYGSHIEVAKGTAKANFEYCSKDGNYVTNMDYEPVEKIIDPLDGKKLYPYQEEILNFCKNGDDDRSIRWYYEKIGNVGKSALCKHICMNYKAIVLSGKSSDMANGILKYKENNKRSPKIIIIDIPRSNTGYISYGGIEMIKNGCFYSSKYEGGMLLMNNPVVIVLSNNEPDYSKMSNDRFKVTEIFV